MVNRRRPLAPVAPSRALAAAVPGARLEVIRGLGHMLPSSAPIDSSSSSDQSKV